MLSLIEPPQIGGFRTHQPRFPHANHVGAYIMDKKDVFPSGTHRAGNRRPTSLGTSTSLEASLPSRVSPVRRDGYSSSSSPLVEHTRRVAMEAQAFRTHVSCRIWNGQHTMGRSHIRKICYLTMSLNSGSFAHSRRRAQPILTRWHDRMLLSDVPVIACLGVRPR
jgi:hypothetical protein